MPGRDTTLAQRDPVVLGPDQRLSVEQTIRDTGETRNWTLHALNVRTNHVRTAHDFMIGLGNNPKQTHLSSFRMADHPRAVSAPNIMQFRCRTGHLFLRRQRALMENHPVDTEPVLHLPEAEGKESLYYRHQDQSPVRKRSENALCL